MALWVRSSAMRTIFVDYCFGGKVSRRDPNESERVVLQENWTGHRMGKRINGMQEIEN